MLAEIQTDAFGFRIHPQADAGGVTMRKFHARRQINNFYA